MMGVLAVYIITMNSLSFLVYGIDKSKAKRKRWRVSENMLLGFAILGGSVGAMIGMKLFHHKTKKKKFVYGLPFILLLQILVIIGWKHFGF